MSNESQMHDMTEIKKLVNKVQDYAEKNKHAYLIPEHMLLILLEDEKCSVLIKQLTKDENKKNTIPKLKEEISDYINSVVEEAENIAEINPTNAYTKIVQSAIAQGALRSMSPDSLCVFIMLFNDKDHACSYFLHKHGIEENEVQDYVRNLRSNSSNGGNLNNQYLSKYALNLTEYAREGKVDPLIGREKEIERVTQVLAKKRSSCPVLVGNAGTGKSAVVEGLALKIANDDVPSSLIGKTIYGLDLTSMLAGTKFRGEFEDRLEKTIKEASEDPNAIVFIDELHTIVGAGAGEGSMDSANILKPYLSRGQIRVIGATTYDEYKNKIEKDKALCRRFKKIDLAEPSQDETIQIIKGLRSKYEEFHGIKFSDEVIEHAVKLSGRYIIGRFFPDKAVDVIDEVGAKYHSGLKKGKKATLKDVEDVICSMANIDKLSVESDDKEKLRTLGDRIKDNLYGQDEIVDKLVRQVRMSKAGLANVGKPLMAALCIGGTGCGKTELAKTLAQELGIGFTKLDMSEYQEEYSVSKLIGSAAGYVGYEQAGALTEPLIQNPNQVILLDEIEKANKSVYDLLLQVLDEGKLTDNHGREASFRNAIVIMTSNVGCAGAENMSNSLGFIKVNSDNNERKHKAIEDAYKKKFSPEFRNRLTNVFYFNPLNEQVMGLIVDKNIRRIRVALLDKEINIKISNEAKKIIVDRSMEENAGGRPVERIINSEITEKIADEILFGSLSEKGGTVSIDEKENELVLSFS